MMVAAVLVAVLASVVIVNRYWVSEEEMTVRRIMIWTWITIIGLLTVGVALLIHPLLGVAVPLVLLPVYGWVFYIFWPAWIEGVEIEGLDDEGKVIYGDKLPLNEFLRIITKVPDPEATTKEANENRIAELIIPVMPWYGLIKPKYMYLLALFVIPKPVIKLVGGYTDEVMLKQIKKQSFQIRQKGWFGIGYSYAEASGKNQKPILGDIVSFWGWLLGAAEQLFDPSWREPGGEFNLPVAFRRFGRVQDPVDKTWVKGYDAYALLWIGVYFASQGLSGWADHVAAIKRGEYIKKRLNLK
jgi:hypothetical protein